MWPEWATPWRSLDEGLAGLPVPLPPAWAPAKLMTHVPHLRLHLAIGAQRESPGRCQHGVRVTSSLREQDLPAPGVGPQ
jgi:hypothetical protein